MLAHNHFSFDIWLSRILEWFVSSCISDQVVVFENWYGVEFAIWAHAAGYGLAAVEMSFLRTGCRSGTCIRKERNSSVRQVEDLFCGW